MAGFVRDVGEGDLKPPFDSLNGRYVTVTIRTGDRYSGKVDGINESYVYLRPHQTIKYSPESGPELYISEESARLRVEDILVVIPSSEEFLDAYCKFQNRENKLEREFKEAERKAKLDGSKQPGNQ